MAASAPPKPSDSHLIRIGQEDFSAGGEQDIAPHLIDSRGFYHALNGILTDDGSVFKRGGSAAFTVENFGAGLRFVWDGYLGPGLRTIFASVNDFGVRGSDGSPINLGGTGMAFPKPAREIEGLLFLPGGTIYGGSLKAANYTTGTVTTTNGSKTVAGVGTLFLANVDAGMLFRTGSGERIYVVASVESNTSLTLADAYEGATAGGNTYSLKALETATAPYVAAELYGVVGDRLLYVRNRNQVAFSDRNKPHSFPVNNFHELDEGVVINAIERLGPQNCAALTSGGVSMIQNMTLELVDALGNVQQRIDQVTDDLFIWGAAGVGRWKNSLVLAALDGVYTFDGANPPNKISNGASSPLRDHVRLGHVPGGAAVSRDHFILPILDSAGAWQDTLIWRLDRPIKTRSQTVWPWTQLLDGGAQVSALTLRATDGSEIPRLLGADNKEASRLLTDDFSTDTVGAGLYRIEGPAGEPAVVGGALRMGLAAATTRLTRNDRFFGGDIREQLKIHTGSDTTSDFEVAIEKHYSGSIRMRALVDEGLLRISKAPSGPTINQAVALAPNTDYWLRLRIEMGIASAEIWDTLPAAGGAPMETVSYSMTDEEQEQFALPEEVSIRLRVPDLAWSFDDFLVDGPRGRVTDCTGWFEPSAANALDHDSAPPSFEMVTRDYEMPDKRLGRARQVRLLYELESASDYPDPEITCDLGSGLKKESPEWGSMVWGDFIWTSAAEAQFDRLDGGAGPKGGNDDHSWLAARRGRYMRLRLRSSEAAAKLVIRGIEMSVAPGGLRHGKVNN